jgi:hypothetical protein
VPSARHFTKRTPRNHLAHDMTKHAASCARAGVAPFSPQPLVPRGLRPKAVRPSTSHSRRSEPRPRLIARARVHHPTRPPTLPAQLPLCATDPGKRAYVPFKAHHAGQTNRRALGVENPREQPARARCEVRPPLSSSRRTSGRKLARLQAGETQADVARIYNVDATTIREAAARALRAGKRRRIAYEGASAGLGEK